MTMQAQPGATILVALDDIDIPARFRKPDEKKVNELARSIEADGLLQPIGLRKGEAKPYSLVFGGHRLASHRKLERTDISGLLFDMTEEEAEAAMAAENAFRNPLSKVEYIRSIKRWQEIHAAKFPETVGTAALAVAGKKGFEKRESNKRKKAGPEALPTVSKADEPEAPAGPEATRFDRTAAAAMNTSESKVRRDVAIAKALSESDLDVLESRNVSMKDLERLSRVEDESARKKSVSLVASGMDAQAAIAFATAPENATFEHVEAAVSGVKPEAEMGDDEWLEHYCQDALARLSYQASFRKDAIVWRNLAPLLNDLRKKAKKALARSKAYKTGPFHFRATSLLDTLHPNDWPKCGPCNGTGNAGNTSQCPSCHGHGFVIAVGGAKG